MIVDALRYIDRAIKELRDGKHERELLYLEVTRSWLVNETHPERAIDDPRYQHGLSK